MASADGAARRHPGRGSRTRGGVGRYVADFPRRRRAERYDARPSALQARPALAQRGEGEASRRAGHPDGHGLHRRRRRNGWRTGAPGRTDALDVQGRGGRRSLPAARGRGALCRRPRRPPACARRRHGAAALALRHGGRDHGRPQLGAGRSAARSRGQLRQPTARRGRRHGRTSLDLRNPELRERHPRRRRRRRARGRLR